MQYRILGVTEAQDDQGDTVASGGARLRALLTALALRPGRTVGVATLVDEVWADDPPLEAVAALQALVGRLRRTLGKDTVVSSAGGYRLVAEPDDVDLFRFERLAREGAAALADQDPATAARVLREALDLWRGPALSDLPDPAAAARPEAQRLEAVRARAEADLLLGRAADLVPELLELTRAHPFDEPLHGLLIRALRTDGRGADALGAYEQVRRTLVEGLGTEPGPQLRALYAELLAPEQEPAGAARDLPGHAGVTDTNDAADTTGTAAVTHAAGGRARRGGNLRRHLTSFVGREVELDAIRAELRDARLVTLTGPGGSGKTRLAEEAAAALPEAWLAELAPLERPEAVPGAVVSALGLRETMLITSELSTTQDDPVALLVEYCSTCGLLLILDNCEHVVGAAADLAETLLTHCPGLTVLATSREPLGVPGESVRPVEPLPPAPAHRLFAERAMAVHPGFDASADTAAVEEICRRLDGLPLAIELAAARLRLLTPRQIADRLDDRFRLLTGGSRTALPRQQTLRAVVDWSWDLLDEQEKTVLCEVSVFAGGWDLAAAEAVCSGPVADTMGALLDKSLLVAAPTGGPHGGGMRYRMLDTIAEYAAARAAERPATRAAAELRHGAYIRELVATADPLLRSAEQLPWIERLETELDNIRAALHRAVVAGEQESACALALGMGWFWWLRNYRREGSDWIEHVLRLGFDDPDGGGPLFWTTPLPVGDHCSENPAAPGDGPAAPQQGLPETQGDADPPPARGSTFPIDLPETEDHPLYWPRMKLRMLHVFLAADLRPMELLTDERSQSYIEGLRAVFDRQVPAAAEFPGLIWPFTVYFLDGPDELRSALDSALATSRRFGGTWEVTVTLMFRTHMIVDLPGGMAEVGDDLVELRELSGRVGDRWAKAQVNSAMGEAAMAGSRFEEARSSFQEALRLAHEVGAHGEKPFLIARLAEIDYHAGDRAAAVKSLDEASASADRYGVADSRAYILLLRAKFALDDGETAGARALVRAAREEAARGTPPPQFAAALGGIDARVTAAESGPAEGLKALAEVLHGALRTHCSEAVTSALLDCGATMLSAGGRHRRAARLRSAAAGWRGGRQASVPERAAAEEADAAGLAALGAGTYERERTAGATLTADEVLAELAEANGAEAPPPIAMNRQWTWLRDRRAEARTGAGPEPGAGARP